VLGAEGAFALTLPLVIGPWSDAFHTPMARPAPVPAYGDRAARLLPRARRVHAEPVDDGSPLRFAFFFAYCVYESPYRGLYPDLLPESMYGRAQGVQHLLRAGSHSAPR
jgi:hypothetical protein